MPSPHFLNIDLDIRVHADPQALIDHWQKELTVLVDESKSDLKLLRFECVESYENAAECIQAFCTLVEQLPPDLMQFWQECLERVLDIGYESGSTKPVLIDALSAEVLIKLGRYFTGLNFTIYPTYETTDTVLGIEDIEITENDQT